MPNQAMGSRFGSADRLFFPEGYLKPELRFIVIESIPNTYLIHLRDRSCSKAQL